MAKLHRLETGYSRPWPLSFTAARTARETISAGVIEDEAAYWKRFGDLHEALFKEAPEMRHCHGDLFYDNMLIVDENTAFLIDFEDSFFGPWMGDVGVAIMALGFRDGAWKADRVKAFLEGYRKAAALSAPYPNPLPRGERGNSDEVSFPHLGAWTEYGAYARTWWRLRHVLLGNSRIIGKRDWKEYLKVGNVEAVL
jgi:Ser/Thr protein kinase RdoA (MazF antagonist)